MIALFSIIGWLIGALLCAPVFGRVFVLGTDRKANQADLFGVTAFSLMMWPIILPVCLMILMWTGTGKFLRNTDIPLLRSLSSVSLGNAYKRYLFADKYKAL